MQKLRHQGGQASDVAWQGGDVEQARASSWGDSWSDPWQGYYDEEVYRAAFPEALLAETPDGFPMVPPQEAGFLTPEQWVAIAALIFPPYGESNTVACQGGQKCKNDAAIACTRNSCKLQCRAKDCPRHNKELNHYLMTIARTIRDKYVDLEFSARWANANRTRARRSGRNRR